MVWLNLETQILWSICDAMLKADCLFAAKIKAVGIWLSAQDYSE